MATPTPPPPIDPRTLLPVEPPAPAGWVPDYDRLAEALAKRLGPTSSITGQAQLAATGKRYDPPQGFGRVRAVYFDGNPEPALAFIVREYEYGGNKHYDAIAFRPGNACAHALLSLTESDFAP